MLVYFIKMPLEPRPANAVAKVLLQIDTVQKRSRILQHFLLGTSENYELLKRLSAYVVVFLSRISIGSKMQCMVSKLDIFIGFGSPITYLHLFPCLQKSVGIIHRTVPRLRVIR